ncbi:YetF domain-containing protein [Phytopseudomonas dryadis]|uniref:DUF421 domain-containing protein n=1 Tax=Phytopseudomonas dryadis TaxID=2487520 RepID=A0A4Q9R9Q2_9GAMM|nr:MULTISPECIES: YetF domain-containing protein [Pseudomonas]TBU97423.1 DUF421 domain-containing protein [Pseudomonas dryadis]TBV09895.1 DUF421 domain-containing protein [Pseudomonas dryadis]TBV15538.1 DUF421 domain-containing protein [Pseudomonas sp. FRB 230]
MPAFDWQRLFLDGQPLVFLGEVVARTLLAYIVVFLFLKVAGRRGVKQLSLFELVVILTLGSAAGDMTFYEDVPLLPVLTVFVAMSLAYRLTTQVMSRSPRLQRWMEGEPFILIRDGRFELETLTAGNISHDEFLMELRQGGVEHLGQVRLGIVEINGGVSLYFYDTASTRPGLPVLPAPLKAVQPLAQQSDLYACNHCGELQQLVAGQLQDCPRCGYRQWVRALSNPRA